MSKCKLIDIKVNNCIELISDYENSNVKDVLNEKRNIPLRNSKSLLIDFIESGVFKLINTFNPLDILIKSYTPCEDDHSDLLAAMLNPNMNHGIGKSGIEILLELIIQKTGENIICNNIAHALKSKKNEEIEVITRSRDAHSAIDIKIIAHDFVIGIENKKSYGVENTTASGPQTKNQMIDLIKLDKPKENSLYVYIHPMMKSPKLMKSPKFKNCIMLDKNDINLFYKLIAHKADNRNRVAAFLSFYSEYYYKTI